MIVYPVFVTTIGLDDGRAGIFHDVAQVVGAGCTISPRAGDIATYVKLLRIAMLLPVVFAIPLLFQAKASRVSARKTAFPLCLSEVKSGDIRDAIPRGLGG